MNTGASVIEFLKRDLALLKRIGTDEQKRQIPLVEAELDQIAGRVQSVAFATERDEGKPECAE